MSRMASSTYDTGRVAERCAATGEPLNPGDPFVAGLFESESSDGLVRRDYTPAAWVSAAKDGLFASWRGVTPDRQKQAAAAIDTESLLGLFDQLGEAADAKRRAFRYVLALILLRKRALLPAGTREARSDRPAALLVRARGAPTESEPVEVIDPAMDEQTVSEITESLRALLRLDR